MILTYDAMDSVGRVIRDTIEAASTKEAVDQLRRKGLFVTRIVEAPTKKLKQVVASPRGGSKDLPLTTLVHCTRQMAMLLTAGSGLVPAFQAIQRQMKRPAQASLIGRIVTDLEDGLPLTDALRKHPRTFDPVYCAVVAAGEASGTLAEMFERLASIVGKRRAMRKKVLGSLAYPTLLVVMCVKIFGVLLFFVIPRFAGMFSQLGVEPPATTKILLSTSTTLQTYWMVPAGLLAAGIAALVWLFRTPGGRQWASNAQLLLPVVGKLRSKLIQGQIFRTMGTLLESGVSVLETIDLARESTRNQRYQKMFNTLVDAVTSGGRLSTTFEDSGLVEPFIAQAIHTGEDSGSLGKAMTFCADMLDEMNEELINVVTRLIEPIILIGMGLVVGAVAVSLFVPLFDLTSAIR